jgi:hypothetical protein
MEQEISAELGSQLGQGGELNWQAEKANLTTSRDLPSSEHGLSGDSCPAFVNPVKIYQMIG